MPNNLGRFLYFALKKLIFVIAASSIAGCFSNSSGTEGADNSRATTVASNWISHGSTCSGSTSPLIGTWIKTSPASTQTDTFTACEVSVSKSNGCTATFSYEANGNILTNKLLTVSPANCGTVGAESRHAFNISGGTLTIGSTVFVKQ